MKNNSQQQIISIGSIMERVDEILLSEMERLPQTLEQISPDKRLEFVTRLVQIVIKYKENSRSDGWSVPEWK